MEGPLAGIRVLEVANWLAAPAGCALLADFGADVIKVEPPNGDPYRGYRPGPDGRRTTNVAFAADNRGKRAITLSLDQPGARDVLYRLVADADVFVTNLLPRRRERYGLTYDDLIHHRPDLIFVSVTGYGQPADRERSRSAGFVRHVVKPADPGELLEIIEEVAAERRTSSPQADAAR